MKYLAILLPILMIRSVIGQNLVPNSGFEDLTSCPAGSGEISKAAPWSNPNLKSPDLYHSCVGNSCANLPFVCVPDNWVGSQLPYSGNGYAGILVGAGNENREFIQVQLSSALTPGQQYTLTYHLSLADDYQHAIDRLGVHFSTTAIFADGQLPVSPQLVSAEGVFLRNKSGWMEIKDTLTANGGEVFMTIGNFNDEPETDFIAGQGGTRASAYYYIDEVTLVPTEIATDTEDPTNSEPPMPSDDEEPTHEDPDCELYLPNAFSPNGDGVNDLFRAYSDCRPTRYELIIFNRWGAKVFEATELDFGWNGRHHGAPMPSGIYLYQLRYADGRQLSGTVTLFR